MFGNNMQKFFGGFLIFHFSFLSLLVHKVLYRPKLNSLLENIVIHFVLSILCTHSI